MGQLRFVIPRPERIASDAPQRAYFAGAEGVPWEARNHYHMGTLTIERETRESGNLYFPWSIGQQGEWMLSTASLMERVRPYNLPVELARGTLNRVRNQSSQWQAAGMQLTAPFLTAMKAATKEFAIAASSQNDPVAAGDIAERAIGHGFEALNILGREYTRQVLAIRRGNSATLTTLLAARLEVVPDASLAAKTAAAFNTIMVSPCWSQIEATAGTYDWDELDRLVQWCKDSGLRICMGPLLSLDARKLPDWLYLWEEDPDELEAYIFGFLQAVVQRYRGRVQLWHVAAKVNVAGAIEFSEEDRLRMTVEALQRVRTLDTRTPTIVSLDQPWGEYIARQDQELSPFHFADTLVRGELGLAGIGLEWNLGYSPHGTQPRDCLEVSRHIDRWTQLGLPLVIMLTLPSGMGADPLAKGAGKPIPTWIAGGLTTATQQKVVEWLLPLLISKQAVQAVVWNQLRDDVVHDLPYGGLFDARRKAKPALQTLAELRREFLS